MNNLRVSLICATLLIVGLVNAYVLAKGIERFNLIFQLKDFTFPPSPSSSPSANVIVLSPDRFAVVNGNYMSVYEVDKSGQLKRTDDVDTSPDQLQPVKRYAAAKSH